MGGTTIHIMVYKRTRSMRRNVQWCRWAGWSCDGMRWWLEKVTVFLLYLNGASCEWLYRLHVAYAMCCCKHFWMTEFVKSGFLWLHWVLTKSENMEYDPCTGYIFLRVWMDWCVYDVESMVLVARDIIFFGFVWRVDESFWILAWLTFCC